MAPGEGRIVPDAHILADDDEEALIVYTWRIAGPTDARPLQAADWQTVTLQRQAHGRSDALDLDAQPHGHLEAIDPEGRNREVREGKRRAEARRLDVARDAR